MKSKTVASIMRHVASKIPSVDGEVLSGEEAKQAAADAAEAKRTRRAAKKEGHEEDLPDENAAAGGANEEARLEQLYDQVAWPLSRKYGHTYDAFKLALTYVRPLVACDVDGANHDHRLCTASRTSSSPRYQALSPRPYSAF